MRVIEPRRGRSDHALLVPAPAGPVFDLCGLHCVGPFVHRVRAPACNTAGGGEVETAILSLAVLSVRGSNAAFSYGSSDISVQPRRGREVSG